MALRRHKSLATMAENVTQHVTQIIFGNRVFHLREPIDLRVRHDHGHCLVGYEPLNLEVYADSEQEALEAFAESFDNTWRVFALAPDRKLTLDARDLKRRMLKLVKSADDCDNFTSPNVSCWT